MLGGQLGALLTPNQTSQSNGIRRKSLMKLNKIHYDRLIAPKPRMSKSDSLGKSAKKHPAHKILNDLRNFESRDFSSDPVIIGCPPKVSTFKFADSSSPKECLNNGSLRCPSVEPEGDLQTRPHSKHEDEILATKRGFLNSPKKISFGKKVLNRWKKLTRGLITSRNKRWKEEKNIHIFGRSSTLCDITIDQSITTSCIILPESTLKIIWSTIMIIALIFTAIYVPIRIAFLDQVPLELLIIEYIVDAIFFCDIFVNFFSAYYDDNHTIITDKKRIAKKYLTGWFLIDLVACFPFALFDEEGSGSGVSYNKLLRLLRLGRLYRMLRIFTLLRALKIVKNSKTYEKILITLKMNAGIKRLIKAILTFFIVVHFFGCMWFYIAKYNEFEPDTWVVRYSVLDRSPGEQYLFSFYWVMTLTTIGYGDIFPYTNTERFVSLIFIFIGVGFVSYSIGSLSSIMLSSDSNRQKLQEKLLLLDETALRLKMNTNLYYKIKTILRQDLDHESLLEELPPSIRSELVTLLYEQNNIGAIAFFHGKSPDFMNEILPMLKHMTLEKNEILYRDGDWADERGVKMVSNDNYIFRRYIKGSYFGESEILRKENFRIESIIVSEDCELLALKKTDLDKILAQFPENHKQMLDIVMKRDEKNTQSLQKARLANHQTTPATLEKIRIGRKDSVYNIQYLESNLDKPKLNSAENQSKIKSPFIGNLLKSDIEECSEMSSDSNFESISGGPSLENISTKKRKKKRKKEKIRRSTDPNTISGNTPKLITTEVSPIIKELKVELPALPLGRSNMSGMFLTPVHKIGKGFGSRPEIITTDNDFSKHANTQLFEKRYSRLSNCFMPSPAVSEHVNHFQGIRKHNQEMTSKQLKYFNSLFTDLRDEIKTLKEEKNNQYLGTQKQGTGGSVLNSLLWHDQLRKGSKNSS